MSTEARRAPIPPRPPQPPTAGTGENGWAEPSSESGSGAGGDTIPDSAHDFANRLTPGERWRIRDSLDADGRRGCCCWLRAGGCGAFGIGCPRGAARRPLPGGASGAGSARGGVFGGGDRGSGPGTVGGSGGSCGAGASARRDSESNGGKAGRGFSRTAHRPPHPEPAGTVVRDQRYLLDAAPTPGLGPLPRYPADDRSRAAPAQRAPCLGGTPPPRPTSGAPASDPITAPPGPSASGTAAPYLGTRRDRVETTFPPPVRSPRPPHSRGRTGARVRPRRHRGPVPARAPRPPSPSARPGHRVAGRQARRQPRPLPPGARSGLTPAPAPGCPPRGPVARVRIPRPIVTPTPPRPPRGPVAPARIPRPNATPAPRCPPRGPVARVRILRPIVTRASQCRPRGPVAGVRIPRPIMTPTPPRPPRGPVAPARIPRPNATPAPQCPPRSQALTQAPRPRPPDPASRPARAGRRRASPGSDSGHGHVVRDAARYPGALRTRSRRPPRPRSRPTNPPAAPSGPDNRSQSPSTSTGSGSRPQPPSTTTDSRPPSQPPVHDHRLPAPFAAPSAPFSPSAATRAHLRPRPPSHPTFTAAPIPSVVDPIPRSPGARAHDTRCCPWFGAAHRVVRGTSRGIANRPARGRSRCGSGPGSPAAAACVRARSRGSSEPCARPGVGSVGEPGQSGKRDSSSPRAGGLWHSVPVDQLFPPTRGGPGCRPRPRRPHLDPHRRRPGHQLARTPSTPCWARPSHPSAASGCCAPPTRTPRRATVHHQSASSSPRPTPPAMSALAKGFTDQGLADRTNLMPRPYAAKGTIAASRSTEQRALLDHVRPHRRSRRRVYAVSGWADGRTVDDPQPAAQAMTSGATTSPRPGRPRQRGTGPRRPRRTQPAQDRQLTHGAALHEPREPQEPQEPREPRGSLAGGLSVRTRRAGLLSVLLTASRRPQVPAHRRARRQHPRREQMGPQRHAHRAGLAHHQGARASPSPSWTPAWRPTTPTSSATSSPAGT
ncbi:hypothetical protein SALBM311S_12787 [Streptomyces alboniger]